MKSAKLFVLVLVTAPNLNVGRKLGRMALKNRLVACVNLIPKLESHYWWQGKMEVANEVLLLLKTTKSKLAALERLILANHPYDTPELLVASLSAGNERYLKWLMANVR